MTRFKFGKKAFPTGRTQYQNTEAVDKQLQEPERGLFWENECIACHGTGCEQVDGYSDYLKGCLVCQGTGTVKGRWR